MLQDEMTLTTQIVDRSPLESGGYSGNEIERVTLRDGRRLILKRVSAEWDWLSRATNDRGRIGSMWSGRLFERIPGVIEHATVAVEAEGNAWSVFMHDVSEALFPHDRRLDRAAVRRVLGAMSRLHEAFWGEDFPDLCGLEDRYLVGGLVELACHFGLGFVYADDDAKRAWATSELSWWTRTVDKALETWSPR